VKQSVSCFMMLSFIKTSPYTLAYSCMAYNFFHSRSTDRLNVRYFVRLFGARYLHASLLIFADNPLSHLGCLVSTKGCKLIRGSYIRMESKEFSELRQELL
jgi:hypothetical protein